MDTYEQKQYKIAYVDNSGVEHRMKCEDLDDAERSERILGARSDVSEIWIEECV